MSLHFCYSKFLLLADEKRETGDDDDAATAARREKSNQVLNDIIKSATGPPTERSVICSDYLIVLY